MKIGKKDAFEFEYMAEFRRLAAPHGIFIEYSDDRAGRDIGIHFTQTTAGGGKIVTPALIYFQMKGIMSETLPMDRFISLDHLTIRLEVSHLRFWYINPQPTYLAVYVECCKSFYAIDVKKWVTENYGDEIFCVDEKTKTLNVTKNNIVDDSFFVSAINRNLVPALRKYFEDESDREVMRFLRDSAIVKWIAQQKETGFDYRLRIRQYGSKMRTEAYFESRSGSQHWEIMRSHWEFSMDDLRIAFPYLAVKPFRRVVEFKWLEDIEDDDGNFQIEKSRLEFEHQIDDSDFDGDDDIDGDLIMDLGGGVYSHGVGQFEAHEHTFEISLNHIGEKWLSLIDMLEKAEVISVDLSPGFVSVAPWHSRDI